MKNAKTQNKSPQPDIEDKVRKLVQTLEQRAAKLEKEANRAQWNAWTTGTTEAYRQYEQKAMNYRKLWADKQRFETVKKLLDNARDLSPRLLRRLTVLYLLLAQNRMDQNDLTQLVKLETKVEEKFSKYRGEVEGKKVSMNDIKQLLEKSKDRQLRKAAWEAQKAVGLEVAPDIKKLMKLRNTIANKAGLKNFWEMQLITSEIDPAWLMEVMDRVAQATDKPFQILKKKIDKAASETFGISTKSVMPWDMTDPFFQELPTYMTPGMEFLHLKIDPVTGSKNYYASLGFDVQPILARSSLYEAPGKNPHAFSMDMDRQGDVRILCNVKDTLYWHSTMLHELGHALYSSYISQNLPWSLHIEAHPFTTEGVAMFFEAQADSPAYLETFAGLDSKVAALVGKKLTANRADSILLFTRWCQVMVRFEKAAYENPDQDLDELWWNLVQQYQYMQKPPGRKMPDWASKIHIAMAPVYYQNYLLGQLFAAQLRHVLKQEADRYPCLRQPGYVGCKYLAKFFIKRVFEPGNSYKWNELIKRISGEELNYQYLIREITERGER